MSAKPRCRTCGHRPGPRIVTATRKTAGNPALVAARVHKKPCDCDCHQVAAPAVGATSG